MTAVPPPLESAMEANALARAVGWDDGYLQGAQDALTEAAEAVEAHADGAQHKADDLHLTGLYAAARIVAEMARDGVPRRAGGDQQPESGSTPVRDSEGPQIAAEGFGDE